MYSDLHEAVLHSYRRDARTPEQMSSLSSAGFEQIGVEVDIGSRTSSDAVVIDRAVDQIYPLEEELPAIWNAYNGPIILDITDRRSWPFVDAIVRNPLNDLSYSRLTMAIGSIICSYFGDPAADENGRCRLPAGGFGLVLSRGSLLEAELLHENKHMRSLFWLPDPAGTEDLLRFMASTRHEMKLYYFLPFNSPARRLGGLEPVEVIKRDMRLFERARIDATPIGKYEELLKLREIVS